MQNLYRIESHGTYGKFALEINVDATKLPNLNDERISTAAWKAAEELQDAIMTVVIANDPDAQQRRQEERAKIVGLFKDPIFVEEIPNGYCPRYCCRHLPWFIVTTAIGPFQIGWRKRVISIDWKQTVGTKLAEELFAAEDTTKDGRSIHAWSYEKAAEYIETIIMTANNNT